MAVLLCAEALLRLAHPQGAVAYGPDARQYRALPHELERAGAAPLSVVGSSRGREAVDAPTLARLLGEAAGSPVRVANYAMDGARGAEVREIVEVVAAASPKPRLVLYGISPRILLAREAPFSGVVHLWTLRDWWEGRGRYPVSMGPYAGGAVRSWLGRHLYVFRYAPQVREALSSQGSARWREVWSAVTDSPGAEASPFRGHRTQWNRRSPHRSRRVSVARAKRFLEKTTRGRPYTLSERQLDHVSATLAHLEGLGVPAAVFEVPVPRVLERAMPQGAVARHRAMIARVAAAAGVPYWSVEDLGLQLSRRDFREQSHMNLRGARKLTRALSARAAPLLLKPSGSPAPQGSPAPR